MITKLQGSLAVLVLDNLPFHHSVEVKDLLDRHHLVARYLPPYSCGLNSIEPLWALLKQHRRQHEISVDEGQKVIEDIITSVPKERQLALVRQSFPAMVKSLMVGQLV